MVTSPITSMLLYTLTHLTKKAANLPSSGEPSYTISSQLSANPIYNNTQHILLDDSVNITEQHTTVTNALPVHLCPEEWYAIKFHFLS